MRFRLSPLLIALLLALLPMPSAAIAPNKPASETVSKVATSQLNPGTIHYASLPGPGGRAGDEVLPQGRNHFATVAALAVLAGLIAVVFSALFSVSVLLLVAAFMGLTATISGAIGKARGRKNRRLAVWSMAIGIGLLFAAGVGYLFDTSGID